MDASVAVKAAEIAEMDDERSRASATFRVLLGAKSIGATASRSSAGRVRRPRSHWFLWSVADSWAWVARLKGQDQAIACR